MPNIRKKGADAELELCRRLQPFFPQELKRRLEQVRSGGSDIEGAEPFVIEVKRVEDCCLGNKNSWWKQVTRAAAELPEFTPVVAFRPSRSAWRYLLPAELVVKDDTGWIEAAEETFLKLVIKEFESE